MYHNPIKMAFIEQLFTGTEAGSQRSFFRLSWAGVGSPCNRSKMLYQQTAAPDQVLPGEQRAMGASTKSDRATMQEMSDDISIIWQAAAGIIALSFSPGLSIT